MDETTAYTGLKILSYVVLAAGALAIGYAAVISITYWTGIGV